MSIFYYIEDTPIQKEVVFFLAEIPKNAKINIDENEIIKYEFMSFENAKDVLLENTRKVLEKADQYIKMR